MRTNTAERIVDYIKSHGESRPKNLGQYLGIGNVALFRQLKKLIAAGSLAKKGSPPLVYYVLADKHLMSPKPQALDRLHIQKMIHTTLKNQPFPNAITHASLFGSYLHNSADVESDIDLLVEVNDRVGYFELAKIQAELERQLGKPVDLVTAKSLSKHFRHKVMAEAEPIYG